MAAGERYGITPYGTEAMHVLRAEAGFIIVGQETDGTVTPQDLGMAWAVNASKPDFLGRRSLERSDMKRADRKQLVGLQVQDATAVLPEGSQVVERVLKAPPMPMIAESAPMAKPIPKGGSTLMYSPERGKRRRKGRLCAIVFSGRRRIETLFGGRPRQKR